VNLLISHAGDPQEKEDSLGSKESLGDCFYIHAKHRNVAKMFGLVIVHGVVTGQGVLTGVQYSHCWFECPNYGTVYDITNTQLITLPIGDYYAIGRVVDAPGKLVKYTPDEVNAKMLLTGHYGPWDLECNL
jgi:hypothetical protein